MAAKNRLTALQVKNLGVGKHADGGGLWLNKRRDGGAQWFLRIVIHGRRREMGLGSLDYVSIKEAREKAERWRAVARDGTDPIKERQRLRREADKSDTSLKNIAEAAFEARKADLKSDGKSSRWFSPLELHVLPKLGKVPVEEIDQQDIRSTLAPIWHSKGETAKKAMGRLNIVMRYAAAMGLNVDIQAAEKAKELLGRSRAPTTHIPALPWAEVPAFYKTLADGTLTQLALRLLILTAVRSGSLRQARWSEFSDNVWEIPAEHMKGKVDRSVSFRVPLSAEALMVLDELKKFERDGLLFPGQRRGIMSDMTMTNFLKDRRLPFRPHGFRTSFRTWCAEATDVPREVAEVALAHSSGSKVELAYRRTDYLERRQLLMQDWANFVTSKVPKLEKGPNRK